MSIELLSQPSQQEIDKIHSKITRELGEIEKERRYFRRLQIGSWVLNGISFGFFLVNPNTITAAIPIIITVYNIFDIGTLLRHRKEFNRLERETKDLRRELIKEELRGPGGYLVPIRGRNREELRQQIPAREIAIINSVRTPDPKDN